MYLNSSSYSFDKEEEQGKADFHSQMKKILLIRRPEIIVKLQELQYKNLLQTNKQKVNGEYRENNKGRWDHQRPRMESEGQVPNFDDKMHYDIFINICYTKLHWYFPVFLSCHCLMRWLMSFYITYLPMEMSQFKSQAVDFTFHLIRIPETDYLLNISICFNIYPYFAFFPLQISLLSIVYQVVQIYLMRVLVYFLLLPRFWPHTILLHVPNWVNYTLSTDLNNS